MRGLLSDLCAGLNIQEQRRLQLSLEAHGRYITSLIQREGLEGKLPPQTKSALDAALAPPQSSGKGIAPGLVFAPSGDDSGLCTRPLQVCWQCNPYFLLKSCWDLRVLSWLVAIP